MVSRRELDRPAEEPAPERGRPAATRAGGVVRGSFRRWRRWLGALLARPRSARDAAGVLPLLSGRRQEPDARAAARARLRLYGHVAAVLTLVVSAAAAALGGASLPDVVLAGAWPVALFALRRAAFAWAMPPGHASDVPLVWTASLLPSPLLPVPVVGALAYVPSAWLALRAGTAAGLDPRDAYRVASVGIAAEILGALAVWFLTSAGVAALTILGA